MGKVAANVRWRRWREANLLSQGDMAAGIGISLRSLQAIEYGECIPRKSTEQKLLIFQRKLRDGRNTHRKVKDIISLQKRKQIVARQIQAETIKLKTDFAASLILEGLGPSNSEFAKRFEKGNE